MLCEKCGESLQDNDWSYCKLCRDTYSQEDLARVIYSKETSINKYTLLYLSIFIIAVVIIIYFILF